MKKWSLLLIITMITLFVSASVDKPLPWNVFSTKNVPATDVYFCNTCGTPYGRIDIHVRRDFAYNTCEYTTVQVLVYQKFSFGFPRQTFWAWAYLSGTVTIPANSADGYSSYTLREGEQVHTDGSSYVIPGDVLVDDLAYCY